MHHFLVSCSSADLEDGVVGEDVVDADVGGDGVHGAVSGLMGDGAVGGAAEVGVGDEASPEAVGAVGAAAQSGSGGGGLDEVVDRLGVQGRVVDAVAGGDLAQDGAGGDPGEVEPVLEGGERAVVGVLGAGRPTSSAWSPVWLVLERAGSDAAAAAAAQFPFGAELVDGERGELGAAQGAPEPDQ